MFNIVKNAVANVMSRLNSKSEETKSTSDVKPEKFTYDRPIFLGLSKDEVKDSRDFAIRPIFIPRDVSRIPLNGGYAECINGGKSDYNEDQSSACVMNLKSNVKENGSKKTDEKPYVSPVWHEEPLAKKSGGESSGQPMVDIASGEMSFPVQIIYYGIFDGHAGHRVALITSKLLHKHIQEKLECCLELMLKKSGGAIDVLEDGYNITIDDLVIGACEEAFVEMDEQLDRESSNYCIKGGCTALVVIMFDGKVYVANAGDCRAVLCHGGKVTQMSHDFTPQSEKQRLNYLGFCNPEFLHGEFSCNEFTRRVNKADVGKRVLCRQPGRNGWTYKTATEDDLKFPLIIGTGKKARVMGTIGVTRGLGDHDLVVFDSKISIKPFLSPKPEVRVVDLREGDWTPDDVLILGSDGLWDMISNDEAASIAQKALSQSCKTDKKKYTIAAQELVSEARGSFTGHGWMRKNEQQASFDDITAFVIPLKPYLDKWKGGLHLDDEHS